MNVRRGGAWMWSEACAMLEEAEQRHRRFFELLTLPARRPVWEPPVDVFVVAGELYIVAAMPGVRPDAVAVELSSDGLWIRAHSQLPLQSGEARIVRLEIPYGRMRRRIDLPPGHYALVERRLDRGCLFLRLTRAMP